MVHTASGNWFGLKDITGPEFRKAVRKLDKDKLNAKE